MGSLLPDEKPLLEEGPDNPEEAGQLCTRDGSVDFNGDPAIKNQTGSWRACPFILGEECCERLAFSGIAANLVTYLRTKLHDGNVSAARNVNIWTGTCYLAPLVGAVLADAYWGRYYTVVVFSVIYFVGMCTVTMCASLPALTPPECFDSGCPSATPFQYGLFFVGLYLIALGTGGIKPCIFPFGADQFDQTDPAERVKKGSFFNWFFFAINIGSLVSRSVLVYVQENVGWGVGFGAPALAMGAAIGFFLFGTRCYRFQRPGGSPITRLCQVVVASFRKRCVPVPTDPSFLFERTSVVGGRRKIEHTDEFRCLDKACVVTETDEDDAVVKPWKLCTVTQVEELKIVLRMCPIWATAIVYGTAYSQMSTMFILQGTAMDTKLGSFTIPPASLSTFEVISVICLVPVYDKIVVPLAGKLTGKRGFSDLQRIGIGLFISVLAMAAAALVEIQRLRIAVEMGLAEQNVAVPMSVLWQIPQYTLVGASTVFAIVGHMQFFYDQSPYGMRSLSGAWYLSAVSLGSYLNSFVLTVVNYLTTRNGNVGWIPENLNEGHLDYYFWLFATIWAVNLGFFGVCSWRYKQMKIV